MTRQQKWAAGALERVGRYCKKGQGEREYRTLCMKMPVLVKQSGLVQALAFVRARSELGRAFCADVACVYGLPEAGQQDAGRRLTKQAQDAPLPNYLALTRDLTAIAMWFRRFAQSELKAPEGDSDA